MMKGIFEVLNSNSAPLWLPLILGFILGCIGSLLVNLITPWAIDTLDSIKEKVTRIKRKPSYVGTYDCEYFIPWKSGDQGIIKERISLKRTSRRSEKYVGYLIPNPHDNSYRKPFGGHKQLRLTCHRLDGNHLVGWWQHPDPLNRNTGCFMMKLDEEGRQHSGMWSCHSSTHNRVLGGRWIWVRTDASNDHSNNISNVTVSMST